MFDPVDDSEELYRRVPSDQMYFKRELTGEIRVSRSAFSDRRQRPSVDRAQLCRHDPSWTQKGDESAGVVSLLTQNVRLIGDIISISSDGTSVFHTVDVVAAPEPDNIAHAEIITVPHLEKNNPFKRLQGKLAEIAKWEILPAMVSSEGP